MGRKSKKAGLDVHAELIQPVVQQELTQHCKAALFQQKIKKQGMFDQFKPPWTPKPSSFFLAGLVPKIPMMVSKKRCLGVLHGQNCLLFPIQTRLVILPSVTAKSQVLQKQDLSACEAWTQTETSNTQEKKPRNLSWESPLAQIILNDTSEESYTKQDFPWDAWMV